VFFKHESAVIDKGAKIGDGCRIWHFVHVCKDAVVGKNVSIGQGCFIGNRVTIGDGSKIQNNVSVYDNVYIENDVFCGPSVVFTNVINPRAEVDRKLEFKNTNIRAGATLGANCTIICGVTIGTYAFVGAGAVITADVPDFALMVGNPARQIGWISRNGQKLNTGNDQDVVADCPQTRERYIITKGVCKPLA
jgi:UDP-2-acetamido-3-amino-2,3-dideoxy-glucuronate N-acetyltransferase